jgi:hypothetical protein
MRCIFCGTKDNLSTAIKVKTANGETTAQICQAHEDDASPKKVRELVEANEAKMAGWATELELMGYKIVPITAPAPTAQAIPARPAAPTKEFDAQQPADTKPAAAARPRKVNSAAKINAPSDQFSKPSEGYDTSDAPAITESEAQEVLGVGGIPVMIPKTLVGESGKTDIRVVTAMNDADIQKRFKNVTDGDTKFKVQDYGLKDCTFCNGTGRARIGNALCPRCKGVGQS